MPTSKNTNKNLIYRSESLSLRDFNKETREFTFTGSSEYEAKRWGITEILSHDKKHIRLDRAKTIASILLNHDSRTIAAAIKSVDIVDGKTVLVGRFTTTQRGKDAMTEVEEEALKGISVGYIVHEWELDEENAIYRAIDWEPYEWSLTPVPVDPEVGVGRSAEEQKEIFFRSINRSTEKDAIMPQSNQPAVPAAPATRDEPLAVAPVTPAAPAAPIDAKGIRADAQFIARQAESLGLAGSDFVGMSRSEAQNAMLDAIATRDSKAPVVSTRAPEVTEDAIDKRRDHFVKRLQETSSFESLYDLARANGCEARNREDLKNQILMTGPYRRTLESSSSLGLVTALAGDKAMIKGYDSYVPWSAKVASIRIVNDFKAVTSAGLTLGAFNTPGEGNPLTDLTMDDFGNTGSIAFKGGILQLTEEAIWNDDVGLFFRALTNLGFRGHREEDKVCITALEAATFAGNSTGTDAFALAGLKAAWVKWAAITDKSGELLGVDPALVLLPPGVYLTGLEETTTALGEATNRIFASGEQALQPVHGRGLTDSNNWYLFADPMAANGLDLLKHSAYATPKMEEIDAGNVIARKWKIKYPLGAMVNYMNTDVPAGIYKSVVAGA